jgi:hypothetical protein
MVECLSQSLAFRFTSIHELRLSDCGSRMAEPGFCGASATLSGNTFRNSSTATLLRPGKIALHDDREFQAKVVRTDPKTDLITRAGRRAVGSPSVFVPLPVDRQSG